MLDPQRVPSVAWHVSSYSGSGGGNCVEAGPVLDGWRTSSHSGSGGSNCVEAAQARDQARVAVRDTKNRAGGLLLCPATEWQAFLTAVRTPA